MIRIISFMFFGFIALILLSANMGWQFFMFDYIEYVPFKDKALHFILVGGFAFFANLVLKNKCFSAGSFSLLLGSVLVFAFMTLEEFSQIFLVNRSFDLVDLTCNYLGILVLGSLSKLVKF